jgi:hypothetical protein
MPKSSHKRNPGSVYEGNAFPLLKEKRFPNRVRRVSGGLVCVNSVARAQAV